MFNRRHFLAFLLGLLTMIAPASGQVARPQLERALVAKLLAEANQVREREVTVGPMQAVQEQIDRTATATGGVCVTFIAPVFEAGRRVRTVQKRIFYFDEEWGWYLFAIEDLRGGDGIDVVSERKGRMVLR